jgi:hypothetical protein
MSKVRDSIPEKRGELFARKGLPDPQAAGELFARADAVCVRRGSGTKANG